MANRSRSRPKGLLKDPKTSARMALVRQHGTKPELVVRRAVSKLGHRYRVVNRDLPGSPDLANRTERFAIFVHGCFWHRHARCRLATTPKRNANFWLDKFRANVARDRRVARELVGRGYRVLVVWQCESEEPDSLDEKLERFFA